jgi:hypothetical protein
MQLGRGDFLHEAFAVLRLDLNFEVVRSLMEAQELLSFAVSRFPNVFRVMFPFSIRGLSVSTTSQFRRMEHLHVKNIFLERTHLLRVGEACPVLRTLSVVSPYTEGVEEGWAVIAEVRHFPALVDLTLSQSPLLLGGPPPLPCCSIRIIKNSNVGTLLYRWVMIFHVVKKGERSVK